MEILVCVKRVPQVGGKIAVTADGQEVDTRASGFSISPHEECAVEEAVQITERDGGSVSVLTLGRRRPRSSSCASALALGARRAVLLETDGRELGPIATAAAIAAEVRARRQYDLVLLGNEAADTGDYQVGVRVAHELGWPVATGIKSLESRGRRRRGAPGVPRRRGGVLAAAARRGHRQGGHQPAPLPVAARAAAGQARRRSTGPRRRVGGPKGCASQALRVPEPGKHQAEVLGEGWTRCRRWSACWRSWGCCHDRAVLVELDGGERRRRLAAGADPRPAGSAGGQLRGRRSPRRAHLPASTAWRCATA